MDATRGGPIPGRVGGLPPGLHLPQGAVARSPGPEALSSVLPRRRPGLGPALADGLTVSGIVTMLVT